MREIAQRTEKTAYTRPDQFLSTPNELVNMRWRNSPKQVSMTLLSVTKSSDSMYMDIMTNFQIQDLGERIANVLAKIFEKSTNKYYVEKLSSADDELLEKFLSVANRIFASGKERELRAFQCFMDKFELSDILRLLNLCVDKKVFDENLINGFNKTIAQYRKSWMQ